MIIALFVIIFALIGAPVFAVMAGTTELAWLLHDNESLRHVRFLAPDVLDERFAGSPILVTVPLFTFIGYVMAESKTPERIVRASNAFFGWMPGGLAIVCIFASAFFTTLTGGSAVTIVAIGALLYPALVQRGYPKDYSLGLVMTGGSLGLLLPPSLPILIYSLVAGIDFTKAFKACLIPGFLVILLLSIHAAYVGIKAKIPRVAPNPKEMASAMWIMKWELGIPVLILGGLFTGLAGIDEVAAIAAAYVLIIETYIYKDIKLRDFPKITRNAMALAGAVLLIMAMAMSLTNYIISEQIPSRIFEFVTGLGVTKTWHFLITLNVFLYIQGMFMDGFSSILVAVPLLIPFAAKFVLSPFHMAMMFLLNLEIAYLSPPLGQNLFVASFRFNKPMIHLYRVAVPFLGVLIVGLVMLMTIPKLSTAAIEGDIEESKARSAEYNEPPREAWLMECVQEDRNNPLPCTDEDRKKWLRNGQVMTPSMIAAEEAGEEPSADDGPKDVNELEGDALLEALMAAGEEEEANPDEALMDELMGVGEEESENAADKAPDAGAAAKDKGEADKPSSDDELMQELMEE